MTFLFVLFILLLFFLLPTFSVREPGNGRRGGVGRVGRRGGGRGEGLGRFRAGRLGRGVNGGVLHGRPGGRRAGQNNEIHGNQNQNQNQNQQQQEQEGQSFDDAFAVLTYGLQIVGFQRIGNNRTSNDRFRAHYGISAKAILAIYCDLGPADTCMKDLLIAMNWLKCYEVEHCMSSRWKTSEQTLREKVREYVAKIRELKAQKVSRWWPLIEQFFLFLTHQYLYFVYTRSSLTVLGTRCLSFRLTAFTAEFMSHGLTTPAQSITPTSFMLRESTMSLGLRSGATGWSGSPVPFMHLSMISPSFGVERLTSHW